MQRKHSDETAHRSEESEEEAGRKWLTFWPDG